MLLRFEAVHVHRQLRRRDHVREENKFPSRELRAVAQVQIFRKRIVLPAARLIDARATPKASRPVEIKKAPAPAPRRLFEKKMAVEKHRLHSREQRVAAV